MPPLPLALLLSACAGGADAGDTADTADTAGDTADSGSDTDTAPDTDTDPAPPTGRLRLIGTATVLDTYAGTETVRFTDAETEAELCVVTLTLASTEARTDCAECDWAFTVEVRDAVAEVDTACAAVGWADPAATVGTTRGYGYVALYFGHAPVLLVESGGAWEPIGYAEYDATTGALAYERDDGFRAY